MTAIKTAKTAFDKDAGKQTQVPSTYQTPTSAEDTSGPVCSDGRLCQGQTR